MRGMAYSVYYSEGRFSISKTTTGTTYLDRARDSMFGLRFFIPSAAICQWIRKLDVKLYVTAVLENPRITKCDWRSGWKHLLVTPTKQEEGGEEDDQEMGQDTKDYWTVNCLYRQEDDRRHDFTKWQLLFPHLTSLSVTLHFDRP
jgi:hypothetical protein